MEKKERYEQIGYCRYRDTETNVVGYNFVGVLNEQDKQIKELEKELEYMTKQAKKFNSEAQKYYEDAYCNNFQNQKAIEVLEDINKTIQLAKALCIEESNDYYGCLCDMQTIVNKQIIELRGNNNNE